MADREKVIDILGACGTDDCDNCPFNGDERCSEFVAVPVEVLNDAIVLLKEQEETKIMPNDDYIKRSDALMAIQECFDKELEFSYDNAQSCMNRINAIPAADVELVRHGHNVKWDYPTLFECSLCGWECFDTVPGDTDTYQYCPNCGAKMDAEPPKETKNNEAGMDL